MDGKYVRVKGKQLRLSSRERAGKPLFVSVAVESKGPNGHGGATYPVVPDEA